MYNIKSLFNKPNIIGLVADQNQGKSNTLYYLIHELRKDHKVNIYTYGLRNFVPGSVSIHSVEELEQVRNSIVFIDEMFSLFDLDNRKIKACIENTIRMIFHNNNVLVICGLGENFKKFISAKLHAIIYKKVTISDLINGSSVKNILMSYKGPERGTAILNIPLNEMLVFDGLHYNLMDVPYMPAYDTKKDNPQILKDKEIKKSTAKSGISVLNPVLEIVQIKEVDKNGVCKSEVRQLQKGNKILEGSYSNNTPQSGSVSQETRGTFN